MTGIEKAFGGVPALVGATLSIAPAEIMGLIGQNGAGKSTMIKILNGAHGRDSGQITFDGTAWSASSPQAAQRLGVSTIFQELNLIPLRSVTENIYLGREIKPPRPIIGALFGTETDATDRAELFIFITPRVINLKEAGLTAYNHNLDTSREYVAERHRRYMDSDLERCELVDLVAVDVPQLILEFRKNWSRGRAFNTCA